TQQNIQTLQERGAHIVGPADGPLTGDDSGPGRMVEPDEIVAAALAVAAGTAAHGDLAGRRVAVSTGGTREPIDPVRFLGNRSSGRQGAELALTAADRGAAVTLVAAHVDDGVLTAVARHPRITLVRASTAADLESAMTDAAATA
ncbi:bifunctional phosphopantothenoylcysteine decarboxylase/phosphopantothenate synthase, partial [Escherichia coli]|nr:bifunctional phosphopantothenoylcysteine decarboxylase/phosphopantothenate synthase [Escherichia coli]